MLAETLKKLGYKGSLLERDLPVWSDDA